MGGSVALFVISIVLLGSCSGSGTVNNPVLQMVLQSTERSTGQTTEAATTSPSTPTTTTEPTLTNAVTSHNNTLPGATIDYPEHILHPRARSDHLIRVIEKANLEQDKLEKASRFPFPLTPVDIQFAKLREYYIHFDKKYLEALPNPEHEHTWGG